MLQSNMYIKYGRIEIMEIENKDYAWHKTREELFQYLVNMQLRIRRLSTYNSIFNNLEKFMQSLKKNNYSVKIVKAFRKKCVIPLVLIVLEPKFEILTLQYKCSIGIHMLKCGNSLLVIQAFLGNASIS